MIDEWISRHERMPDDMQKVELRGYSDAYNRELILVTYYHKGNGMIDNVTHWRPAPTTESNDG